MKPFDCDGCGLKVKDTEAAVVWFYDSGKRSAAGFRIIHDNEICGKLPGVGVVNRKLTMEYVYAKIPEFIAYISRLDVSAKSLKDFVRRIEKGRSYIRRHAADKKEVKKMIVRLEGLKGGEKND